MPDAPLTPTECAQVLRGLADPTRLRILTALQRGPSSVGGLVEALQIPQYKASRHLAALAELGLVTRERRGRYVYYALSSSVAVEGAVRLELGCCRFLVDQAPS